MRMPRFDVDVLVDGIETMRRITQQGRDYHKSCSYVLWTVIVGNEVYTCCIITKDFARAASDDDGSKGKGHKETRVKLKTFVGIS